MSHLTILFLAANPVQTSRLRLDKEAREIESKIRSSAFRDVFRLRTRWAVTPDDLLQALNEDEPTIVHFSGHGTQKGIILDDSAAGIRAVSGNALSRLFRAFGNHLRVVVLNACYSRYQARALLKTVDCVIGMRESVNDEAAIAFASSFYRALGFGKALSNAYEQGLAAMSMGKGAGRPVLLTRDGVDPATLFILPKERRAGTSSAEAGLSLLWVEDEGERYSYEQDFLQRSGWSVSFAGSVAEAARLLSRKPFDSVIVDLVLPFASRVIEPNQGAWGGLILISWLYGNGVLEEFAASPGLRDLRVLSPHAANVRSPLAIATAYVNNEMLQRIDMVSPRSIEVIYKPVEMPRLLAFLDTSADVGRCIPEG